eukprot:COSAG05_NODE_6020_length_1040_cov_1.143464_1_plen_96_part_00
MGWQRPHQHLRSKHRVVHGLDEVAGAWRPKVGDLVCKARDHRMRALKGGLIATDQGGEDSILRALWATRHSTIEVSDAVLGPQSLSQLGRFICTA